MANFRYIFSTGAIIDTNSIHGVVIESENLQPSKGVLVAIYRNYTDSSIINQNPDYYTITDGRGAFSIDNIKRENYKIISIEDKNNNKRWEKGERLGFISNSVNADSTGKRIIIPFFKQSAKNDYLISATSNSLGVYDFVFDHENVKDIKINQEDPGSDKRQQYYTSYHQLGCESETQTKFLITNLHPKDSAHFNYEIDGAINKVAVKVSKQKETIKPLFDQSVYFKDDSLDLIFIRKLEPSSINKNKIVLSGDTSIKNILEIRQNNPFGLTIKNINPGNYKLLFLKGAFSDIYGIPNDSFQVSLKVLDINDLQTLILTTDSLFNIPCELIISGDNNYCFHGLVEPNKTYKYTDLPPGKYKIIAFIDNNKNGIMDPGNIFKQKEPETPVYYKELDLRTGFEIEEKLFIMNK